MRAWLRERLKDGPTHINVVEIEAKASDWHMTPLQAALAFKELKGDLWEGEFITVEEPQVGYEGAWVERVH